jgi:hypothetical protein
MARPAFTRDPAVIRDLADAVLWDSLRRAGGCRLHVGVFNQDGYGIVAHKSARIRAHRLVWMAEYGPIEKGLQVLHSCDNPRCVNPQHLRLGTNKENVADCIKRGRRAAKLSKAQVLNIRSSTMTNRPLAAKYGVAASTISRIRSGKRRPGIPLASPPA